MPPLLRSLFVIGAVMAVPWTCMAWTAAEVDFPGENNSWTLANDSAKYTGPDGFADWFRYTETATGDNSDFDFKLVNGNDFNQDYGGNTTFPKNELAIMFYQPIGDTPSKLAGGITNGYRYVYTARDPGLADTFISVMELSDDPAFITNASGGRGTFETNEAVKITILLNTNPPPEQKVYVRFTTDGFASDSVVEATISGAVACVTFTNLSLSTVYEWYALSSTASSNYLENTNGLAIDALTLSWDNNGGSNYVFATPGEASFLWHNNNRVTISSNAQMWVKMGYMNGDGSGKWVTNASIYYTTDGVDPSGGYGSPSNGSTQVASMEFSHSEQDAYQVGEAMWWVGNITNVPGFTLIKYKIGAWYRNDLAERFADYGTGATNDAIFTFQLGQLGDPELTVNGVSANYTTTKMFVDEIAGDSEDIVVVYKPGVNDATIEAIEVFSNLDRRDLCDVDYTNAFISGDGYADGIKPPDGNLLSVGDTGAYFAAFSMTQTAPGEYTWTGTASRCGAYRLTARFRTNSMPTNTWIWYSDLSAGRRDHAIVVSPTKIHEMTLYELNTLTVEASENSEAGRSTFVDLLGAPDDGDGYDPFNLDYLNFLQANCLWFQPIHPGAQERGEDDPDTGSLYEPGSPYASRNYFAVTPTMGTANTEQSAMEEFTNFVAQCDVYTGSVGTINIMLDGVFNHTSWDAEMGQGGVDLGFSPTPTNRIGHVRHQWYSRITDYGEEATYYNTAFDNDFATAPDRGDFGKWSDVADLYFGKYSALVRHNPENNGDYLNEDDSYDFAGMTTNQMDLWRYFAYYAEYWLQQTGHPGSNTYNLAQDNLGIDGLRCDFGQGLPPQCWEYIINATRKIKWNFIFMAETLDGGIPGYRSNRHFDILNESIVFQFTQAKINDAGQLASALEDRRNTYSGGPILLNQSSHDEVMPDDDAWVTASRFGSVSAIDGLPMMFYGQEQGIGLNDEFQPDLAKDGFAEHEENFGKLVPHFKRWNQLQVWTNPPPFNNGMDQWYGRVNWARLNSPALRSKNRYFLSTTGGGADSRIFSVAKYETPGSNPADSDVILAFARFLEHGQAHTLAANTFNLQGPWNTLGMDTAKLYTIRNRASSDAGFMFTNGWPRSGQDLFDNGIFVSLHAGDTNAAPANVITDDGALVQYLDVVELDETVAFDSDNDSIYDGWEWKHFNTLTNQGDGDNDNDGLNDAIEFIAGTQPTNAGSAFILTDVMTVAGPTNRSITIPTEPGKKYAIEFTDGMISNNLAWTPFGNTNNGVGTWCETSTVSTTYTFTDDETADTTGGAPTADQRTYRVRVGNP